MFRTSFAFSLSAACGVMDSYGLMEDQMESVLRTMRDNGQIMTSGYVMQRDLDRTMRPYRNS